MKDITGYEGLYAVTSCGKVWSHRSQKFLSAANDGKGYLYVTLSNKGVCKNFHIHRLVCGAYHENPEEKPCVNHLDECPTHNWASNLAWCTYKENNNYGHHNEKMSASKKGTTPWNKGLPMTEEQKQKLKAALKGRLLTEEHKNKLREANLGKKRSEETKKKLSKALKGRPCTWGKKQVLCIETNITYESITDASLRTGLSAQNIGRACREANRTSGGYHWEFAETKTAS